MANEMYVQNPAQNTDPAYGLETKVFSANYLKALYAENGAWKHTRNHTDEVSSFGQSVTIPKFPRLTPQSINQTTGSFSYDATQIEQSSVVINKWKAVPFLVLDYLYNQSKIDINAAFADAAARALNDDMDHEMLKLVPSLTTNSAGTLGSDLDESKINSAIGTLLANYANLRNPDDLVFILPASQYGAVKSLKGYSRFFITPGSNTEGGSDIRALVETIDGIPVFFRNDSEMSLTGGKIGGLFYRDSVGIAIQKTPSLRQPLPVPGKAAIELVTTILYGINLIKEPLACKILCK
jgi:hypothetical protein